MKQELQQIADHLERINRDLHSEMQSFVTDKQSTSKEKLPSSTTTSG